MFEHSFKLTFIYACAHSVPDPIASTGIIILTKAGTPPSPPVVSPVKQDKNLEMRHQYYTYTN